MIYILCYLDDIYMYKKAVLKKKAFSLTFVQSTHKSCFHDRFLDREVCGVQKWFVYTVKLSQAVLACV